MKVIDNFIFYSLAWEKLQGPYMSKLLLQEVEIQDKRVLMRVDFNVPLNKHCEISDDTRIRSSLTSIKYVLEQKGSLVLMSHLGRPKGKRNAKDRLVPCAKRLSELLNLPVQMAKDCIGPEVEALANQLQPGQILLLENLRFHPAEENPSTDPSFAENLSKLGDIYCNDAFATAHREHSSTVTITRFFPNEACAGFLMDKEIAYLGGVVDQPKRPFYAIIGGSKISSKIGVLKKLAEKVDGLFIGGGMTFTFLKAQGIKIGNSIVENDEMKTVKEISDECQKQAIQLCLPSDLIIAPECKAGAETKIISIKEGIPDGWLGLDIGPKTIEDWHGFLQNAATVFWNGPLGVFEIPDFAKGTQDFAKQLAKISATTIIGGGDSVSAINQMGLGDQFTHLSTGGGAALEFIEYGHLPGIDALSNR